MTVDNSIIEKVKKILALASNNPSEEEADLAMLKAQEIMAKNGLSIADISENFAVEKIVKREEVGKWSKTPWWHKRLSNIIAKNFRCETFRSVGRGKSIILFFGLQEDVDLAKNVFSFAVDAITYSTRIFMVNKGKKLINESLYFTFNAVKNDYIQGFLSGLESKFSEQVRNNGWGLVLVKDEIVVEAFKEMSGKFRASRVPSITVAGSNVARSSGYNAGKNYSTVSGTLK